MSRWPRWATFPNPVNDLAARVVAAGVVVLAVITVLTASPWSAAVLALGFAARVLAGPRFSLLGQLATRVVAPRLGPARLVPGPPKRFAQAVGLVFALTATVLFGFELVTAGRAVLAVLIVFALLESALGFCAGCWVFGLGIRVGLVPASVCAECADVRARYGSPSVSGRPLVDATAAVDLSARPRRSERSARG